jgi:hypothetical protein
LGFSFLRLFGVFAVAFSLLGLRMDADRSGADGRARGVAIRVGGYIGRSADFVLVAGDEHAVFGDDRSVSIKFAPCSMASQ